MADECKVQLEGTLDAEARKQASHSSKLTTVVLLFALCLAAAAAAFVLVFHMHHQSSGHDKDTSGFHHTLRQISNVRAAIHLEGVYNPERKTAVEWRNEVDQSHSQGGLRLNNNEIVIPQSGLYFVYSQVSFEVNCTSGDADTDPNALVHLSHTVQRWSLSSGDDYRTILHSARTACQKTAGRDEGSWYTAVYMGAVFNLMKGDRLQTVMEERMLPDLAEESGKNFFGVFAL
ncbi:tumor necrosis factor-like [Solea senegalensis]|uniref:Tumor necrosis factor-like n=1 Tax=Solea senegalensis TaxID=28829 RepID=A0AAV6R3G9_SOLSE|nr:tumor necrosis factor a (TNF superfamily, member 2) [Solea senegalensis]KAG7499973.1 tumor necrosis factor-like [Solea senegalensis]